MPKGPTIMDDKTQVNFDSPATGPVSVEIRVDFDEGVEASREEHFSDNSGIITLELGFDPNLGFFANELWYPGDRKTVGQNTGILISNLSRIRLDEILRKIHRDLSNFQMVQGVLLKMEIDALVADLNTRIKLLAANPGNFRSAIDAKAPIYGIVKTIDDSRDRVLKEQRRLVLEVLVNDHRLQRMP